MPAANLPGREGGGFVHLVERLPPQRLPVAMMALAPVRAALDWTVDYLTQRTASGRPLAAFQNTRFELATPVTGVHVLEDCLDKAVLALTAGTLTAVGAARARLWATEVSTTSWTGACSARRLRLHDRIPDRAPVRRRPGADLCGGASEIMKTIIARDVTGLRT